MLCPRCNTQNAEGARYCSGCGSPIGAPAAQATPLAGPASAVTFLAGGLLLRGAISVLAILFTGQSSMLLGEWLLVGMAGAGVLWQVWKTGPREAGDVMAVLAYRFTC